MAGTNLINSLALAAALATNTNREPQGGFTNGSTFPPRNATGDNVVQQANQEWHDKVSFANDLAGDLNAMGVSAFVLDPGPKPKPRERREFEANLAAAIAVFGEVPIDSPLRLPPTLPPGESRQFLPSAYTIGVPDKAFSELNSLATRVKRTAGEIDESGFSKRAEIDFVTLTEKGSTNAPAVGVRVTVTDPNGNRYGAVFSNPKDVLFVTERERGIFTVVTKEGSEVFFNHFDTNGKLSRITEYKIGVTALKPEPLPKK